MDTLEPSARHTTRAWSSSRIALPRRRLVAGWILALLGTPLLTAVLVNLRHHVDLSGALLLFLLLVVAAAVVGGIWPALLVALAGFLFANYFFTPPLHTLTIQGTHNLLALFVFVVIAGVVSTLVTTAARRGSEATEAAAVNDLRAALLAAVSHDLRTPLSSIKASVTSLLQGDVQWSPETTTEFLQTIDTETDRLDKLVGNLLDMSRLQTGGLNLVLQEIGLEEIVAGALAGFGESARTIALDVPETLPRVWVDPALLERAVANVVGNALNYAPDGPPVTLRAREVNGQIDLDVVDRGPGIPREKRESAFLPFQRLNDHHHGSGVGLGLPVARGFVQAMGGELRLSDTPGGGLTVVISLPRIDQ